MNAAIIVAAGRGVRMGAGIDKLFLPVAGVPLVVHTWRRFARVEALDEIILVVRAGMEPAFRELAERHGLGRPFRVVHGGKERQDSVWNGLQALKPGTEVVAIQDGARPCTHASLILEVLGVAREHGAAVAAQRVTDTLKEAESETSRVIVRTVDRAKLWAVQTPQAFRVEILKAALAQVREQGRLVTDDTAACEAIGQPVRLVESLRPNPKATSAADLPYLDWLLAQEPRQPNG